MLSSKTVAHSLLWEHTFRDALPVVQFNTCSTQSRILTVECDNSTEANPQQAVGDPVVFHNLHYDSSQCFVDVIPAQAGIQREEPRTVIPAWIPACGRVEEVPFVVSGLDFRRAKIVTRHVTPVQAAGHTTAKNAVARPAATLKGFSTSPCAGMTYRCCGSRHIPLQRSGG